MKYTALSLCLCFLITLLACNPTPRQNVQPFVDKDATVWLADESEISFLVMQDTSEQIRVKELPSGIVRAMDHVPSASGAKYQDAEGYFFWTKGDDFIWGKGEETIASGKKQRTEQYMPPTIDTYLFGDYVSDGYSKRRDGYDWVSVSVEKHASGRISVSVRSRGDKKRATCTFDGNATVIDHETLKVVDNQASMVITFHKDTLFVNPETDADKDRLFYYCSGGGTLIGAYTRIEGDLDQRTIDKTAYVRSLFYNDKTGFWLDQQGSTITIRPFGLEVDNRPITQEITGEVMGSEVSDMNGDNRAELGIYVDGGMPDHKGRAFVYSSNNGKSISMVNVPELTAEQSVGYKGFDEFAMVENNFVRRFPLFREVDGGMTRTGYTRQIQYKLEEGEAMRQLVVEKVVEY